MTNILQGKTALVTGASRGIGRATAERLAASGALVAVHYANSPDSAREVVTSIEAKGGQAFMIQADLEFSGSIKIMAEELETELVRRTDDVALDILVNNAGGGPYAPIQDTTEAIYDKIFELNTRSPFFIVKALLTRFRSGGSVINLSSEATRLTLTEYPVYTMAKSALEAFTRVMAKELGPRGIRVNAVCPGIIRTAQSESFVSIPEQRKQIEENTALRRIGHTDDIAEFIHALVSPASGYVTGQVIEVSGGYLL